MNCAEAGDRAAHVAEHDQLGAVRALRLVMGDQRDAAGRHGGADGTPEVERSALAGVPLLGEPGRQPACERVDLAAHLLEVGLARGGEVEPVDAGLHRDVGDVVGALLLGDPAARVALDLPGERADPPVRDPGGLLLGAPLGQQRGDDPVDEVRRGDALERGVRRPAGQPGTPAGHRPEPAHHLHGQPGQPLLVAVGERLEQLLPELGERIGVVPDRPGRSGCLVVGALHPFPHERREVDVEQRLEGRPLDLLLDQRGGVRVADGAPLVPVQRRQGRDRVQVLGQRDGQARAAQRLEEGDVRFQ